MPVIYFDACCLNRPFDEQDQVRVRLESEAIVSILEQCERGEWTWIASDAIQLEVSQMPDLERRELVLEIASCATRMVRTSSRELARADALRRMGFGAEDALHIACAERAAADVLLTTDDRMLKRGRAHREDIHVRIENPLSWLKEVYSR